MDVVARWTGQPNAHLVDVTIRSAFAERNAGGDRIALSTGHLHHLASCGKQTQENLKNTGNQDEDS